MDGCEDSRTFVLQNENRALYLHYGVAVSSMTYQYRRYSNENEFLQECKGK